MKIHNLCDPNDHFYNESFTSHYEYYYVNDLGDHFSAHKLDGPAVKFVGGNKCYYIDDVSYKEEEYYNHPKVKEYMYLQQHPEMKAFL